MPTEPVFGPRRSALQALARAAGITSLAAGWPALLHAQVLPATPSCGPDEEAATAAQVEGPFYKRATPERMSLVDSGMEGERLTLSGQVVTTRCRPLPGAWLDFWQADAHGRYDTEGYRLRGHLIADADGRYRLETIVPGGYPGRTRHIHVKIGPAGGRVLTTQLYFPDEPLNRRDGLYLPALQIALARDARGAQGRFDFVLRAS